MWLVSALQRWVNSRESVGLSGHVGHQPLERLAVEVLVHGHLDGEVDRVLRAGLELSRSRGRLDAPVAGAAVLLLLVVPDAEVPFYERDLFALLDLRGHLAERAAEFLAPTLRRLELVNLSTLWNCFCSAAP